MCKCLRGQCLRWAFELKGAEQPAKQNKSCRASGFNEKVLNGGVLVSCLKGTEAIVVGNRDLTRTV